MSEGDNKKGFTVTDRRIKLDDEDAKKEKERKTGSPEASGYKAVKEQEPNEKKLLPEMNFPAFLLSLNTSALISMGLIPNPTTGNREQNMELARQTIDLLGILKEKTKGNLTKEEEDLLNNILLELRLAYVDLTKKEDKK